MDDEGEKMSLTRQQLPGAINDFAKATVSALGLKKESASAAWPHPWKELDHPIRKKADQLACNGPYYFREDKYHDAYAPGSDYAGVYLFFDADDVAIYVGKSEAAVGTRIWRHIGKVNKDRTIPDCEFDDDPEYVFVVPIPDRTEGFIAPALESYLLLNFRFKYNQQLTG